MDTRTLLIGIDNSNYASVLRLVAMQLDGIGSERQVQAAIKQMSVEGGYYGQRYRVTMPVILSTRIQVNHGWTWLDEELAGWGV